MPLTWLSMEGTHVKDLTPLAELPITAFGTPPKEQLTPESVALVAEFAKRGCQVNWSHTPPVEFREGLDAGETVPAPEEKDAREDAGAPQVSAQAIAPGAPASPRASWSASLDQANAAYDENRFAEAIPLYDTVLKAMAADTATDKTVLKVYQDEAAKRRDIARFALDRAKLPVDKQIEVTQAKLKELNPDCTATGRW